MKFLKVFAFATASFFLIDTADSQHIERTLNWDTVRVSQNVSIASCDKCFLDFNEENLYIPFYNERFKGYSNERFEVEIKNKFYKPIALEGVSKGSLINSIKAQKDLYTETQTEAGQQYLYVKIPAYRVNGKEIEKLESFSVEIKERQSQLDNSRKANRRSSWPNKSVLADGNWFKISVNKEGVYKIDKDFLQEMGVSVNSIDPRTIKIYSGQGDILPEKNEIDRHYDLAENSIFISGESDGSFDANDYILFYAQVPSKFLYDTTSKDFKYSKNYYALETVFFLTYGGNAGKRVSTSPSNIQSTFQSEFSDFDDIYRYEKDLSNLIKTGRIWYGEHFDRVLSYSFSQNFANRVLDSAVKLNIMLVGRSSVESKFTLNLNGNQNVISIQGLGNNMDYTNPVIASPSEKTFNFNSISGNELKLDISYNKPLSSSEGWLDYFELRAKRSLIHSGSQMSFANLQSVNFDKSKFILKASDGVQIWDISDPINPRIQETEYSNGAHQFVSQTKTVLKRFISVSSFSIPKSLGKVQNQNLHGIRDVDYIIVSNNALKSEAENLAQFHRIQSNLNVEVVTVSELYNEFSHGIQDVTAIRDFMKMLWDEASSPSLRPKFLLLFGDASYDYLGILKNNTNRVPTYQSLNSHNPMVSFCTDDYFVLMDDNEGDMNKSNIGMLDIAVGRIVANTTDEAATVVRKIKNYYDRNSFGSWRTNMTFIADDADEMWETVFVKDNERYVSKTGAKYPYAVFNKIYLDAFEQKSMGGGQRYPDAVESINNNMEKGTLLWIYNGHGGTFGLASERVIEIPQINDWRNYNKLPLFLTATCEFSRFDDPSMQSAGENTLLSPNGGSIGLLTTTRIVLVSTNTAIQDWFFNNSLYSVDNNGYSPVGLIYKETKNRTSPGSGDRFFSYLGDPAVKLALPRYSISIDSLNGVAINGNIDSLKALSKVTFKGSVLDDDKNLMSSFNGSVFPVVFDKPYKLRTKGNDAPADDTGAFVLDFNVQNSILFNGRSKVTNGKFEFSFIVPKDINYKFGEAFISLYAYDENVDAAGEESNVIIGGAGSNVGIDENGPEIELFMDDYSFVNGGLTGESPIFIASLFDESGINTAGSGIGRELIATIDKDTKNERTVVLNEFFQTEEDSYQKGEIRYRLSNLSLGKHTISLKVWDVYNNSSEASIEFIVEDKEDLRVEHILNYPNPFSTRTEFHFDHNRQGQDITVSLQILTVSGKVVKSFQSDFHNADSHLKAFTWDGRDEFGDKLSKGVYIYRVRVKTSDSKWVEKYEKLLLLN